MIDFETIITGLDGEPIMRDACAMCNRPFGGEPRPLTLGDVCCAALINPPRDVRLDGTKKLDYAVLATRIAAEAEREYTHDDLVTIKAAVKDLWGPLVVLRAVEVLDPAEAAKAKGE